MGASEAHLPRNFSCIPSYSGPQEKCKQRLVGPRGYIYKHFSPIPRTLCSVFLSIAAYQNVSPSL